MDGITRLLGVLLAGCCVQSCSVAPPPERLIPGAAARKIVADRSSVVVVTDKEDLSHWLHREFCNARVEGDSDGGSATPITPDGYFLTANHVLSRMDGRHVFVMYGRTSRQPPLKARVIWRNEEADLALLHIPRKTTHYYQWSPPDHWLPAGTAIIHGGIVTGDQSESGKLVTSLAPEGPFTGFRKFKIDIPLQPGDSGGPIVDAHGALIGINSAVEYLVPMETAFFVDSEACRPNIRKIESLVRQDRAAQDSRLPHVE